MKRKTGNSLSADYATLETRITKGRHPAVNPTELPLAEIKLWPKVFQHRSFASHDSKTHVRTLTAALSKKKVKSFDPITVWWDGKNWACVDGHHRHAAYIAAKVGGAHAVPVEVFMGTIGAAMAKAAESNTKDKLTMCRNEKSNAAWHLVTMTEMTKSEIVKASGVSDSLVAIMRRTATQLQTRADAASNDMAAPTAEFRDLSWADAKRLAENRDAVDFDWEEADEKKAKGMAMALKKALGDEAAKYPEVFARALELYDTRLPDALAEWWSAPGDDETEDAGEF
jgi:hypothetical protein